MMKAETAPTIGHGLGSTRWESWCLTGGVAISVSPLAVPYQARLRLKNQIPESEIPESWNPAIAGIKGFPCVCPARSRPLALEPDRARERRYRTAGRGLAR